MGKLPKKMLETDNISIPLINYVACIGKGGVKNKADIIKKINFT